MSFPRAETADQLSIGRTRTTSTSIMTVTSAACVQKRNTPLDYRGFLKARAADIEDIDKRGNILGLLAAFATAKVSEGCSCLNLRPKATKIITSTAVASVSPQFY